MTKELKRIKKKYGEKFAQLCRKLFPEILEEEGKLSELLEKNFANNSKTMGDDFSEYKYEFQEFILSQYEKDKNLADRIDEKQETSIETRTPYEILEEAGYDLYECTIAKEIQKFKKYYAFREQLCTFSDPERTDRCICFFAVKKDVNKIDRANFKEPRKSDEYSTSVLALQFDRNTGQPQIISRYNHTVDNPNCTLGNELDRLAPGLKQSFKNLLHERGIEVQDFTEEKDFIIPRYMLAADEKFYKVNMELNGDYYCPGNIVILRNGEIKTIGNPEEGILVDYFYIDLKNKKIEIIDSEIKDAFLEGLQEIEKIEVSRPKKGKEDKIITIITKDGKEPITIGIDKNNQMIKYENKNLEHIGNSFLCWKYNGRLNLNIPNVRTIGDSFLEYGDSIECLELPQVEEIGHRFMCGNVNLKNLSAPKLKKVGDFFLFGAQVKKLELPNLEQTGDGFMSQNFELESFSAPRLKKVGSEFLDDSKNIKLPKWKKFPRITSKAIAMADKMKEITSVKVNEAKELIGQLTEKSKENENKNEHR